LKKFVVEEMGFLNRSALPFSSMSKILIIKSVEFFLVWSTKSSVARYRKIVQVYSALLSTATVPNFFVTTGCYKKLYNKYPTITANNLFAKTAENL
jgi:hypothetical protein